MAPLRKITILILILLAVAAVIFLLLGGFAPLLSIACAMMFAYYLVIYLGIKFVGETPKTVFVYGFSILLLIPILLFIFDFDGLLDFLLQGVHLDMK